MASRPKGFGLTAEINRKIKDSYSLDHEQQARHWIEDILGIELEPGAPRDTPLGPDRFQAALKNGIVLCKLINVLMPGAVKSIEEKRTFNFCLMENIDKFLSGCGAYGVCTNDLFHTASLFEKTNMTQVVNTLHALGRKAQANGFNGPTLGVRESEYNPRNFSEEKLKEGQTVIGLQMGSTKGANQQGINFGKARSITD